MNDDCIFGFRELSGGGDARFWIEHSRGYWIAHLFLLDSTNAQRRQRDSGYTGFVQATERLYLPDCLGGEMIYEQMHDVWYTGQGLACGTHGEHCPACDVVQEWVDREIANMWIRYPAMTIDGRLFEAGVCQVPGDIIMKERFE